jgi:hypothetical protein
VRVQTQPDSKLIQIGLHQSPKERLILFHQSSSSGYSTQYEMPVSYSVFDVAKKFFLADKSGFPLGM